MNEIDEIQNQLKLSQEERYELSREYNKYTNLLVDSANNIELYKKYTIMLQGLEEKTLNNKINCRRLMQALKDINGTDNG